MIFQTLVGLLLSEKSKQVPVNIASEVKSNLKNIPFKLRRIFILVDFRSGTGAGGEKICQKIIPLRGPILQSEIC